MNTQMLLAAFRGANLVGSLAPVGIDLAMKIKALLQKEDPDMTITLQQMQEGTLKSVDETQLLIDKWMVEHPE